MKSKSVTFLIWLILIAGFMVLYSVGKDRKPNRTVSFGTFLADVDSDNVARVRVKDNLVSVDLSGHPDAYQTIGVIDNKLMAKLSQQGVLVEKGEKEAGWVATLIANALPIIIFLAVFVFLMRRMGGGNQGLVSLLKSRARHVTPAKSGADFSSVGGCAEAKLLLQEVVEFLKDPKPWKTVGARLPRGVLLEGPPGCGKTLLARAVAGEAGANFYTVAGSEFVELFIGVGAARVRDMFETARKNAPAVIFIDELDAVGRARGSGLGITNDEKETTLNQLLVCLDGFEQNERVVVIAATNRTDILDKALTRPGRLDRVIKIGNFDQKERLEVLKIHTAGKALDSSVSLEEIAALSEGLNGAFLETLTNEAALSAVRRSRSNGGGEPKISMGDFTVAREFLLHKRGVLSGIDSILIDSTNQLTQPVGKAVVRVSLDGGISLTGEVVWANAVFIKIKNRQDGNEIAIAKGQVRRLESVDDEANS